MCQFKCVCITLEDYVNKKSNKISIKYNLYWVKLHKLNCNVKLEESSLRFPPF